MKAEKIETIYVIRCEKTKQHGRRCGSGQVLTRVTRADAMIAAQTHAMRKGCLTKVYMLPLVPVFAADEHSAREFKPPKPREYDAEYGWS